ncbi:hypothetical protein XENOCAPTIV_007470 [Xenoophorus captivus]|uniref:Uncharacterized protein n=1 Tax=Xenoophorus captivus TaxID=1517983 RepID=A0ABV0RHB7_9TELE
MHPSYYASMNSHSESSSWLWSICNSGIVIFGSLRSIAEVMRRTIRERMHGTQQHPQVTIIATNPAIEIIKDIIKPFQCPNMPVTHSSRGLLIPECLCMVAERVLSPSKAFDTETSGAVLLGTKVQHISPNMAHAPPFSANNISNGILFCTAMREVGANCSDKPSTASRVRLARRKTL